MRDKYTNKSKTRSRHRYSQAYVDRTHYASPFTVYTTDFGEGCGEGCSSPEGVDYEQWSRDPRKWGPHLWSYMHYAAANFPDHPTPKETCDMVTWLSTLHVTIPCESCRVHYKKHIDKSKPMLHTICSSRDALFKFLVDTHNSVNKRNKKPEVTYEQAKHIYGIMY